MFTGKEVGFKGSDCRKRKNNYSSLLFHFHWSWFFPVTGRNLSYFMMCQQKPCLWFQNKGLLILICFWSGRNIFMWQ